MSQIRIAKAGDVAAFPASTFVVDDTPPIAQCQEAQISEINCDTTQGLVTITKIGAFAGIDLAGKKVTVTTTLQDNGIYDVLSNTDDVLTTSYAFTLNDASVTITVQDAGQAYLTRSESSFTRFIEAQGNAHTIKGGQLFTDLADPPMDDACTDTWSPD